MGNATLERTNEKLTVNMSVHGNEQRVKSVRRMVNANILELLKIVLKVRPNQKIAIITVIGISPVAVAVMAYNGGNEKLW
tara:strand:+ start:494 stop:733 length:240 start_codon:yes stop_codon:yes gene_type:complete